jgi:branched-subunit amino acid transport protein
MSYTLMILGMAVLTAVARAGLLVAGSRVAFPPIVREALSFVPAASLTAIIVPMVLAPHGAGLELTWRNPHLVGAAAAVTICVLTRHQLVTIVAGLAVFFGWQFLVLA